MIRTLADVEFVLEFGPKPPQKVFPKLSAMWDNCKIGYRSAHASQQVIIDEQAKSIKSLQQQLVDANRDLDDMQSAALIAARFYKKSLGNKLAPILAAQKEIDGVGMGKQSESYSVHYRNNA